MPLHSPKLKVAESTTPEELLRGSLFLQAKPGAKKRTDIGGKTTPVHLCKQDVPLVTEASLHSAGCDEPQLLESTKAGSGNLKCVECVEVRATNTKGGSY